MDGLVVFLAAGAAIGAVVGGVGFMVIALIGRRRGARPDADRLANTVPAYPCLDDSMQRRLETQVQRFLKQKRIKADKSVPDIMRIAVAGNACMLRLREKDDCFPALREVIIDGESDLPRRMGVDWAELQDAIAGGKHNPVVRGCAHILTATRSGNKTRKNTTRCPDEAWWHRFQAERDSVVPADSPLSGTGDNDADIFIAACEAFFQQGDVLAHHHHGIYTLLSEFFGIETAGSAT